MSVLAVLAFLVFLPILLSFINSKVLSNKHINTTLAIISALCFYVFVLASVAHIDRELDTELAKFDLNGDSFFSGEEINPEQEKAMLRVVSDTGRNFAPLTGGIFSFLYFLLLCLIFWLFDIFRSKYFANKPVT